MNKITTRAGADAPRAQDNAPADAGHNEGDAR